MATFHQWQETELYGGRVTTGIGDDPGSANAFTVDFRQSVHGGIQQIGARMRHAVPALPLRVITQAKIGGQIDDAHPALQQLTRLGHRDAIGRGEEHQVATGQSGVGRIAEPQTDAPAKTRKQFCDSRPGFASRRDGCQLHTRMAAENP